MTDSDSGSAQALIDAIANDRRRADAAKLLELMSAVTGETPRVWGSDTIGFGQYHYRYKTGQEGDFFKVGFSPRKDRLTLYIMSGLRGFDDILERLGPHRAAKSAVHLSGWPMLTGRRWSSWSPSVSPISIRSRSRWGRFPV